MNTIIRASSEADVPALATIYQHSVRTGTASFETEPPSEEEFARRRAGILAAGYPYLTAESGGVPVGYAYAGVYRPRPGYRFTVENSVYVRADQQGRGVGKALLPVLISRCEQAGFRLMIAVIGDSANAASINLHRSCGFDHAGVLPNVGWKLGRWLDSVLMTRPLGPGAAIPPPPGR